MLRFFIKVLLFPITLALTLLVAFARFFCLFSGMVLSIIAGAFFLFGVLMLFIGEWQGSSDSPFWHGQSAPTDCRGRRPG